MIRPNKTPSSTMQFKVFVRGENGRWRVASMHATAREAQWTADLLVTRQGFITRATM